MATDLFVLLDFDRTLADTDQLKAMFETSARQLGYDFFEQYRPDLNIYRVIRQKIPHDAESVIKQVEQEFIKFAQQQDFLLLGAQELLEFLTERGIDHGILSFGDADWQVAKIAAAKLDRLPRLITDNPQKGDLIKSWRDQAGYQLPRELGGGRYQRLALVDDKPRSFENLLSDVLKFYCGKTQPLSPDIIMVNNLADIKNHLI